MIVVGAIYLYFLSNNGTLTYSDSGKANKKILKEDKSIEIIVGGDVMFDRNIRSRGEKYGYESFFAEIKNFFESADLVVVNLEGPVTDKNSETFLGNGTYTKELKFTFATSTARTLKEIGVDVVSLANNHTDNFGIQGLRDTKKWLSINGVNYFGDPWNSAGTEAVFEIEGVKIALVGYHYFLSGYERVLSDIKRLSNEGYFVLVMPHWGEEYVKYPSDKLKYLANEMVGAGADAIVGAHPHVIMDHEWVGSVPVFYSLGNLLFDQYFSAEVKKGNVLKITISKIGLGARVKSVEIFDVYNSADKGILFDENSSQVEVI